MKLPFKALWLLSLCLFATVLSAQTVKPDYIDGEIYLKYRDAFPIEELTNEKVAGNLPGIPSPNLHPYGIIKYENPFIAADDIGLKHILRVYFSNAEKINGLIDQLNALPFIEYAEAIPYNTLGYTPNDLGANTAGGQYYLYTIKAREAWDISKGSSAIKVAIVDDALQVTHTDLFDNIWRNPGEISGNGIDDDKNGYIDDIYGFDVADGDNDPAHPNTNFTHGTHVGGIAGASTDNSKGVASIGFNISLMGVKCTRNSQTNTQSIPFGYEGINYAVSAGANIINCSWSSSGTSSTNEAVISYALSKGCTIVAAAGNDGVSSVRYPAAYTGVLAVASTDQGDPKSGFSNYGTWIDISAPGANIYNTVADTRVYYYLSGTSMASPMVAGLLGLMKSHNPNLTRSQLEGCLLSSADNIDSKNSAYIGQLGSGRINAEKALQCVATSLIAVPKAQIQSSTTIACPNTQVQFFGNSTAGSGFSYKWYFTGGNIDTSTLQNPQVTYTTVGTYDVSLVVKNANGTDSITLKNYINIGPNGTEVIFSRDFETGSLATMGFTIDNPDTSTTWNIATVNSSRLGTKALRMPFYSYNKVGQRDGLITPVIDLTNNWGATLTFDHSYRRQSSTKIDSLIIYGSIDSGKTFPYRLAAYAENGTLNFATKGDIASSFGPSSSTDWCYESLAGSECKTIDLTGFEGQRNFRIKFEAYNGYGNNLYIDNMSVRAFCSQYNTSKPVASFRNDDTAFCLPKLVQFMDSSKNFATSRKWYFEGGLPSFSTEKNPSVSYTTAGQYDVKLVVGNQYGEDSLELNNYIIAESAPIIDITAGKTTLCPGEGTTMIATGAKDYLWSPVFAINTIYNDTVNVAPPYTNTYNVLGTSINGCTGTKSITITVLAGLGTVGITKVGDSLIASNSKAISFQWLLNGAEINGEIGKSFRPTAQGNYAVRATDSLGCQNTSANYYNASGISVGEVNGEDKLTIYPNPASKQLFISGLEAGQPTTVTITDIAGRRVMELLLETNQLDIATLTPGVYFVTLGQNGRHTVKKLLVE